MSATKTFVMISKKHIDDSMTFLNATRSSSHRPQYGIILGTGMGQLIEKVEIRDIVPYSDIPHFPTSTVEFHKGQLIFGTFAGKEVVIMQGRFHLYEGYSPFEITFPIRILQSLSIEALFITNVAGAINSSFAKGSLMLIDDHINLQGCSPLAIPNIEDFGDRFVDMICPYDNDLNNNIEAGAKALGIELHKGVYAGVIGPHLETRAEYRYLRTIGADAVGMSTVLEVIVANHLKIPVTALSLLTDDCSPETLQPINIPEIMDLVKKAEPSITNLLSHTISTN